jgi:glycosyltransferase involved in cell wall biosynthesis
VITIYNPLPVGWIRNMARQDIPGVARPTGRFVVGCGRLVRMKGFHDLLDAFAAIRGDHPVQLAILGEGPEREKLARRARDLGVSEQVLMPGFVQNPWSYFGRTSAFVLSSLFGESFSMVLVEAMACGAPVVASRCEWGPEEILGEGRYGLLYPPGDVAALAAHMRAVLDGSAATAVLTEAASKRAEEFSQEAILPELERRITGLLG